jgi:hypothetical protein
MKRQARDWRSGELMTVTTYFDDYVDIHHIFPQAWSEKQGIPSAVYNAIANKTPLTARTNRIIGGYAPSTYLSRLTSSAKIDRQQIDQHISTHFVEWHSSRRTTLRNSSPYAAARCFS